MKIPFYLKFLQKMNSYTITVFFSLCIITSCDQQNTNRFHLQHSEIIQAEPEQAIAIGLTLAKILYVLGHLSLPQLNKLPFLYYPQIIQRVAKNHPSMLPRTYQHINNLVNRFKAVLPIASDVKSTQKSVTVATGSISTINLSNKKNLTN